MKNEIGRKLTSLTIMAIMFAGLGIAQGFTNSFMPVGNSRLSETEGNVNCLFNNHTRCAAILEVVVNDPDISILQPILISTVDQRNSFNLTGTDYRYDPSS